MAGSGQAQQRRRLPGHRCHRRHPATGAAAERGEDRPRQRGRRPGRHQGQARPLQRGRRADGHRLLRRADGGDGPAAGGPRPRRRVGPRLAAGAGDGRAALPAARRAGDEPVRRRAPPRGAVQAAAVASPTCCCSTSRPTTWTPKACSGSNSTWPPTPGRFWRSPTTGTSWTTSPQWILELDRGRAYPYEGNYSTYLEKKAERSGGAGPQGRQAAEAAEGGAGLGAVRAPRRVRPRARRGCSATRRWPPRRRRPASSISRRSRSRSGRGWATSWSRSNTSTRVTTAAP